MVKLLDSVAIEEFLGKLNLRLGSWGGIETPEDNYWVSKKSPDDGLELYVFALTVCFWVPKQGDVLILFDKSTSFTKDELFFLQGIVQLGSETGFESALGWLVDNENFSLIVSLVFFLLLFGHHAYVLSEGSGNGKYLGVHDKYMYMFCSSSEDKGVAVDVLKKNEEAPLVVPKFFEEME